MGLLVRFSTDFTGLGSDPRPESESGFDAELAIELLTSQIWDLGSTGIFQDDDGWFLAGFDDEAAAQAAVAHLRQVHGPIENSISIEQAPLADAWQPASEPDHITIAGGKQPIHLSIRAGGAFGHGGHATTELAAAMLCQEVERRVEVDAGTRVLDVGAGTGILALAAAAAGAEFVVGIDNDPAAVEIAAENLARNREQDLIPASTPITIHDTSEVGLGVLGGRHFDVVVINVLLPVHRALVTDVKAALADGATLITAGYLADQETELVSLYQPMIPTDRSASDDWLGHRFSAV